jgi:riboflavin kinase / FMN adenylyltransferase
LKIYYFDDKDPLILQNGSVVTLGNFDGIHVGHLALINNLKSKSKEFNLPSVLVTYYPNPIVILGKYSNFSYIYSEDKKAQLLTELGIDYLLKIPFTLDFSNMNALDFLNKILIQKLNPKHITIGYNHYFGKNREGDFQFLIKHQSAFQYEVTKIDQILSSTHEKISSSFIRSLIADGNIEKANKILTREFSINGIVSKGFQNGRKIGFPTINLKIGSNLIIPSKGVYATRTIVDGETFNSMTNIGNRPTFDNGELSIETNLFDFDKDIYGKTIELFFYKKIRDEIKFDGVDQLVQQLGKDKVNTKNYFSSI